MEKNRGRYDPEFKARVALEALRGARTRYGARHYLRADGARTRLSVRSDGLAQPQGARLGTVEHHRHGHRTPGEPRSELAGWFERYNGWHPHETLGNLPPSHVYERRAAAA